MTTLLEGRGLSKQFGGLTAVSDVSFTIQRGQIAGLIGPNGAGKTTLFNLVSGFFPPTSGDVLWDGTSIVRLPASRRVHLGMVRTFQQSRLFPQLTVRDNLRAACHAAVSGTFVDDLFNTPRARSNERVIAERVEEMLAQFDLHAVADRRGRELAYGLTKRVGLVMGTAGRPALLMLDEPAAGLNGAEVAVLRSDLDRLRDAGTTVWLVEHHMGLVMEVTDHVLVLDAGKSIAAGTPAEVANDQAVIEAYLGVSA